MKKFIMPEINVVELGKMDAIMSSFGITDKNKLTTSIDDKIEEQYNMWKGLN